MESEYTEDTVRIDDVERHPLILREPLIWRKRGACRDYDSSLFFSGRGRSKTIEQAKVICSTCIVRISCLNFAIDNEEKGVWGGTTEKERKEMIRREVA
jgi:WhiB family redox-sensing transcriptional regulator